MCEGRGAGRLAWAALWNLDLGMEHDPLRFVWRAAPALHVGAFALLAIALALVWIGLDLIRVALDDTIGGRAFAGASAAPFLRQALTLPARIAERPLVFFAGFPLDRAAFAAAMATGLAVVAVAIPLLALAIGLMRALIGVRAVAAVRRTVV